MANTVNVSVGIDPSSLRASETALGNALSKATTNALNRGFSQANFKLNSSGFTQPLGQMTAGVKSFDTVLSSANKRVLGFGASLSIIAGSVRGFRELVSATLDVEKSLSKITSIMPLTIRQLDSVRKGLFDIARQTGSTFDDIAEAFQETAKQGVSLDQTNKRVAASSALARVSNIDQIESVKGLTAAYATFGRAGETYIGIANKISAANRTTLAGAKDLFDVIGQFGEQANDAGISLNRLIAIAATLQTQTGRGGAGLSVSLQRILSRTDSPSTQKALAKVPELDLTDQNGQVKQGIALLDELAKKYNTLSDASKKIVNSSLGSTRDQNIFSNLVKDINDANGSVAKITQVIALSTNDLNARLIQQNNNLATSFANLKTTAKEAGSSIGDLVLKPVLDSLVSKGNFIGSVLGTSLGSYVGKSLLKGIGDALAGPGLVLVSRLIAGIAIKTGGEAFRDARQVIGGTSLAGGGGNDTATLRGVNVLLSQATSEERQRLALAKDDTEQQRILLGILEQQLAAYNQQAGAIARLNAGALRGPNTALLGELAEHAAGGYIGGMSAESVAISRGVGGAPSSSRPVVLPNFAYGGGRSGPIVANTSEFVVPGAGGSSIYNRDMISRYGLPPGSTPVAAGGYVPNAAGGLPSAIDLAMAKTNSPVPSAAQVAFQRSDQMIKAFDQRVAAINQSLTKLVNTFQEELQARQQHQQQVANAIINDERYTRAPRRDPNTGRFISPSASISYPGGMGYADQAAMERLTVVDGKLARGDLVPGNPNFIGPNISTSDLIGNRIAAQKAQQQQAEAAIQARNAEALAQKEAQQAAAARRARFTNGLQYAYIGASIGAGFIPEAPGGTRLGQIRGGESGALQGIGLGGSLGSIFGPGGGILGAGLGGVIGGISGIVNKATQSFSELAQELQDVAAKNDQIVRSTSGYAQSLANLQQAAASGASPDTITNLRRETEAQFRGIPSDVQKDVIGARDDPQKLAEILASLGLRVAESNNKNGVVSSISQYTQTPNDTTRASALDALVGAAKDNVNPSIFGPINRVTPDYLARHANDGIGSPNFFNPIRGQNIENFSSALASSTNLGPDRIKKIADQLSTLDIGKIVEWENAVVEAFKNHKDLGPVVKIIEDQKVNIGDFQGALQDEIDAAQSAFAHNQSQASFQRERSGQILGAASRILGGGKVRVGGQLLSGDDLADRFRISEASQEAAIGVGQSQLELQTGLKTQLQSGLKDGTILRSQGPSIDAAIDQAIKSGDFKSLFSDNPQLESKDIDKLIQKVTEVKESGDNQVKLVRESIQLQRLELQATQQAQLLQRGIYNPSSVSSFNSLATAGLGDTTSRGVNSLIQQGELLDNMGLPQGGNSAAIQRQLRVQSVQNQLRALAGSRLGRRVGANDLSGAATDLVNTGVTSNVELGQRIQASQNLLNFNPRSAVQGLLGDTSGAGDLSKLIDTKTVTTGEGLIVKAIEDSNTLLQKIPGVSTTPQTNPVQTTLTTQGGTPIKTATGPNGVTTLPGITVTAQGTPIDYGKTPSPLAAYGTGFGAGLNDIYDKLGNQTQQLGEIGAKTAENLDNSFSTFFGNFITGTVHSNRAFREFASSIFADESKLFASNAVHDIFGSLSSAAGLDNQKNGGGFIRRAGGGTVPALLTGGEYVIPPGAASRLGPRALNSLNNGRMPYAVGGLVRGGSGVVDDVPAALQPGSFVVKAQSVRNLGPRYLSAMAGGGYLRRASGGGTSLASIINPGIGAGIRGLASNGNNDNVNASGYIDTDTDSAATSFNNIPILNASTSAFGDTSSISSSDSGSDYYIGGDGNIYSDQDDDPSIDDSGGGPSFLSNAGVQQAGLSLAAAGIEAGIAALLAPPAPKALGYNATMANATTLETDIRNGVNSRPAGTFVDMVRGANGQYNIIDATSPAVQYQYGNSGGTQLYPQMAAAGGSVGGSYVPLSDGTTSSTVTSVNPTITIHNYGNGNTSSSVTNGGASDSNSNPLATQEFANQLHKQVLATVNNALVQSQRNGGLFNNKARYSPNQYA